jgi:two-component system NtrC family sensor kinase
MAPFMKSVSLRVKVISLIILIIIIVSASAFLSIRFSQQLLEAELRESAVTLARELAVGIRGRSELEESLTLTREIREVLEVHPLINRIDIFALTPSGPTLVASSGGPDGAPATLKSIPQDVMAELVWERGDRLWDVVVPIRLGDEVAGALRLKFSLKRADELAAWIRLQFLLIMGVAVALIVVLLGALFDRAVDRPIRGLVRTMERAEAGDLSARAEIGPQDEIGELGKSLNHMLSRIEASYRQNVELLDQINRFNEDLKEKVRLATRQLERRNEELRRANELLFDTQLELSRSERLAMVGEMAATIAHEIGTPLTSISGHVQLLLQEPGLDASSGPRLKIMEGQIARTVDILQGFLSLARQADPVVKPLDVNILMKEILNLTSPGLGLKHVIVIERYDQHLPSVLGDAHQLQQVFLNLIANALDAMPDGGELTVETDSVDSYVGHEASRWVRIQITDTGCGITPEDRKRIFEPFFTTKERGRGTGLGLTVCQNIVRAHQGTIGIESQVGKGTTFVIVLPAEEKVA